MLSLLNRKIVVGLLLFARLGFGTSDEFRHCAEQLAVRVLDGPLTARVESYLIEKQGKAPAAATAMTQALNRRMAFFRGYEAGHLWKLPETCSLRGLCDSDSLLLAADMVETLPSAADPYRSVSNRSPFPDFGGNWGMPYMLDVLTLPAASVAKYLRSTDLSGERPQRKVIGGEGRPLPPCEGYR